MAQSPLAQSEMANALRALAMDAVQMARSGHPGAPMGMAEIAEVLWTKHLRHHPGNPDWFNRDRFVLSNGHASMLLYALLHLSGYELSLDDLKQFRQLGSQTPGHPEVGDTPGVETTTGPLGQGLANAVGMALAEAMLAKEFNRPDYPVVDHFTYAFIGDGGLVAWLSHDACARACTLNLSKLIVVYDVNGIPMEGQVHPCFRDATPARARSYAWQVITDVDGPEPQLIDAALRLARQHARQNL